MRHSRDHQASPQLHRLGRCWLGAALIIVSTGPVLALAGIGGSLWGLAGFLVIFTVAVIPLIARELRAGVSLVSSQDPLMRPVGVSRVLGPHSRLGGRAPR